jgi:hypothetical protein
MTTATIRNRDHHVRGRWMTKVGRAWEEIVETRKVIGVGDARPSPRRR